MAQSNRRFRYRGGKDRALTTAVPPHYHKEDVDELLELIYTLKESGGVMTIDELQAKSKEGEYDSRLLDEMTASGLLTVNEGVISFAETGIREAEKLVRAHRLAERLLTDVLLVSKDQDVETQACAMEHVLNPGVVDNICTILNHPKTCPHGHDIPQGPCCKEKSRTIAPAIQSLDQLRPGESGRILYIETTNLARLDSLTTFGMLPGSVVKVYQRQPSFVVIIGETQLALDQEILSHVHVVKTG